MKFAFPYKNGDFVLQTKGNKSVRLSQAWPQQRKMRVFSLLNRNTSASLTPRCVRRMLWSSRTASWEQQTRTSQNWRSGELFQITSVSAVSCQSWKTSRYVEKTDTQTTRTRNKQKHCGLILCRKCGFLM